MKNNLQTVKITLRWLAGKTDTFYREYKPPAVLLLFLVNLLLIYPLFLPNMSDINPYDEAAYINSGRMLLDHGEWASYARNPLVDVLYAVTYLPYRHSPYWLVQSCSLGRVILFGLLWLSAYLVASQFTSIAPPILAAGLLFVTPLAGEMLRFPSDPLFAGLAGLSFWQMLRFYHTRRVKHLGQASLFMGLAALARNDGMFLFILLLAMALVFSLRQPHFWTKLSAALLPFVLVVGGYILINGLATGDFDLGTMRRTYDNFEAGQQAVFYGTGNANAVTEAKLEARRLFGTPQENNFSIFTAIRRNPSAYLARLKAVAVRLPNEVLRAYGIRFAVLLFLLALRGCLWIVQEKQYGLLALALIWPAHLVTGFAITLYREGHLLFPFYVVFALAIAGLAALLENLESRREFLGWSVILIGITVGGMLTGKTAIYYGTIIFLAALWVIYFARHSFRNPPEKSTAALLILLSAGLIIHGNTRR